MFLIYLIMKNLNIFFLVIFACNSIMMFGQKNVQGKIVYEQRIESANYLKSYNLYFDSEKSYYEEKVKANLEKSETKEEDGTTFYATRDNKKPQFYFNSTDKGFFFSEVILNKHLFVKEDFKLKWELSNEIKSIGEYKCQKATTNFRGRKYTVWYTTEIPVVFGPWKLHGLSGLILQAHDDKNYFQINVKNISVNSDSQMKVTDFSEEDLSTAMSVPVFIETKIKLQEEFIAKLSSRLPQGAAPLQIDKNCKDCGEELEYFEEK